MRAYQYEDDAAPLLPRGTILRVTGYYDNTPANRNVVDPRNWSGLGHRSIDNMNILIMQGVPLTDEQFQEEVAARRERLKLKPGEDAPGCPLCAFEKIPAPPRAAARRASSSSHGSVAVRLARRRRRWSAHRALAALGLARRRAGANRPTRTSRRSTKGGCRMPTARSISCSGT